MKKMIADLQEEAEILKEVEKGKWKSSVGEEACDFVLGGLQCLGSLSWSFYLST